MKTKRLRIYLTGVGGQGTLTATTLLSRIIMDQGFPVVSGEIHGMAQRGGVVESTVLLGGWHSPTISHGEADVILGFEPLETLRALPYLAQDGVVFSSTEFLPPPSVSSGQASLPSIDSIKATVAKATGKAWFLPLQSLGLQAGSVVSGNTALLAALCASGLLPFGVEALRDGIKKHLPQRLQEANLAALELGVNAL